MKGENSGDFWEVWDFSGCDFCHGYCMAPVSRRRRRLGHVFISWISRAADGARDFRRSASAHRHAKTALKKTTCGCCGRVQAGWYDRKIRQVRDLSCGDTWIYLELEVRRLDCRSCGKVKRERLDFLADNPLYTRRFAYFVGRRAGRRRSRTWQKSSRWTGTRSRRWTSNTWRHSSRALARPVRR